MKTKKIVAKRFKVTKTGKILRGRQNSRHLKAQKSKQQRRKFRVPEQVLGKMERDVNRFLPYA